MPVFNAGPYLRPAVQSVLAQTLEDWELIVIDDGSTDDCMESVEDIRDPRITRLRQQNAGKPAVMNRALQLVRGQYWAVLDADDLSHPQRLELQANCLQTNPDVAGVFCGHDLILGGRVVAPLFGAKSREACAFDIRTAAIPAHDPTAMYRAAMVQGFEYAEDLPVVEGLDFILRVGEVLPLLVLGTCLYSYRILNTSVTRRDPTRRNALVLEVLRRMCLRRGWPLELMGRWESDMRNNPQNDDNGLASHFNQSVLDHVIAGKRWAAIRIGLACWRLHPTVPVYVKPLVYSLVPRRLMAAHRRSKAQRTQQEWGEWEAGRSSGAS